MSEKVIVSIIMPVYNARKYLRDAVDSILNQTYKSFKLILIDDGATDGSGEICDYYAKRDSRVVVIHQDNQGICGARNTGLKFIEGKYVAFCDHDDIYKKNYLQTAIENIEESGADLIKFGYCTHFIAKDINKVTEFNSAIGYYHIRDIVNDYSLFDQIVKALWNGIYKSDMIKAHEIVFDTFYKSGVEDYEFNFRYLPYCKYVQFIADNLYIHYTRNGQSADTIFSQNKIDSWFRAIKKESKLLDSFWKSMGIHNSYVQLHQKTKYLTIISAYILNTKNSMSAKERVELIKCCKKIFLNNAHTGCMDYRLLWRYNHAQCVMTFIYNCKLYYVFWIFMDIKVKFGNRGIKFRNIIN